VAWHDKYQHVEPKQELRVYLFGKFSGSNKQVALDVFWSRGIRVYDMIHQGPIMEIYKQTATVSALQACIASSCSCDASAFVGNGH
jgi:hypothetical protein